MLVISKSILADQSVYINQVSGDNLSVNITQQNGDGNVIGEPLGTDTYFDIQGDDMTLDIEQFGASNILFGNIAANTFTFDANWTGSSNIMEVDWTNGDNSVWNLDVTGDTNAITAKIGVVGGGDYLNFDWDITGNYNTVDIEVDATGTYIDFDVVGDYNAFDILQSGFGTSTDYHEIFMDMTGSNNAVTLIQDGTLNAGFIDIVTNGSNQVINITQSD